MIPNYAKCPKCGLDMVNANPTPWIRATNHVPMLMRQISFNCWSNTCDWESETFDDEIPDGKYGAQA